MFASRSFDLAGVVAFLMKGAAWVFSAISTAGFLYTFGGPLFAFLLPSPLAELSAALVGVLFVEVPCLTWPHVRLHRAGNEHQRRLAEVMTWVSVSAALALTSAFFVLTFGAVEVPASVSRWAGLLGSGAVVVAFVLNFAAWALFNRADNAYQLQAELQDMQGGIERRAYGQIMLQTSHNVDGLIAEAVAEQTERARERILHGIGGPLAVARHRGELPAPPPTERPETARPMPIDGPPAAQEAPQRPLSATLSPNGRHGA